MRIQEIVSVPVQAHIKKFIDQHLGSPVILDDSSSVLIALKVFLSFNVQFNLFFEPESNKPRQLPNVVQLKVTRKEYIGMKLNRQNLVQINKFFEKLFEEEMHRYIQANAVQQSHTNGYKHEMERFCNRWGIEIEIDVTEDALIKSYYRYREQLKKRIKAA